MPSCIVYPVGVKFRMLERMSHETDVLQHLVFPCPRRREVAELQGCLSKYLSDNLVTLKCTAKVHYTNQKLNFKLTLPSGKNDRQTVSQVTVKTALNSIGS